MDANVERFAVWQMWFGYVFNYDDVAVRSEVA